MREFLYFLQSNKIKKKKKPLVVLLSSQDVPNADWVVQTLLDRYQVLLELPSSVIHARSESNNHKLFNVTIHNKHFYQQLLASQPNAEFVHPLLFELFHL